MARRRKQEDTETIRLNMTPMIDVVFQLLVFFLVTMKFKTLDQRVDAYLPTDRGLAATPTKPEEVPKLVAVLKHKISDGYTRVKINNQDLGTLKPAEKEATLAELSRRAAEARKIAGDAADKVKGEVDAAPMTPMGDVIYAVDAFQAGGLKNVTFIGTPEPGTVLDKLYDDPEIKKKREGR
ncbi:MAG: hypothetical protein HMLKMBBP_00680 [Planctomycetes bacterium]|nr:hypothetical protein [Planctomycetota bacterium]